VKKLREKTVGRSRMEKVMVTGIEKAAWKEKGIKEEDTGKRME